MLYLGIALMVVALIGIIGCQKKQKTNPNAQKLAFVFLVLILVGAGLVLYDQGMFGGADREMNRIIKNETAYAAARSDVVGKYLAGKYAGKKAVIITEKNLEKNKINKGAYDAMVKALKGVDVAATEALATPDPTPDMPAEGLVNAKLFNDIFSKHKDAALFIVMTNLPFEAGEIAKLAVWTMKDAKLVVVNGEVYKFAKAIAAGKIAAAAAMKPNADFDPEKSAPSDVQKAFDSRYILVTPENVKDVAAKNKGIFE